MFRTLQPSRFSLVLRCQLAAFLLFSPSTPLWSAPHIRRSQDAASTTTGSQGTAAGGSAATSPYVRPSIRRSNVTVSAVVDMQKTARDLAKANTIVTGLDQAGGAAKPTLWQGAETLKTSAQDGGTLYTVKQTDQMAYLQWDKFDLATQDTLYFNQKGVAGVDPTNCVAFNFVRAKESPSNIYGRINAEGQVFIINANGIIFGGTAWVNTHALVASTLPINDNLTAKGLLSNPDRQFLFTAIAQPAGTIGPTAAFDPTNQMPVNGYGEVEVKAGAILMAPSTDNQGGRIALIGPKVTNKGTIQTPDGQTILAAGLQVAWKEHDSSDASLRGLDVMIGQVSDANIKTKFDASEIGKVINGLAQGYVNAPRGSIIMTGKDVQQLGVLDSSTSVSLNGRIDLSANYGYTQNVVTVGTVTKVIEAFHGAGTIKFGDASLVRILPDSESKKFVGSELTLPSLINVQGRLIEFDKGAAIIAPGARLPSTTAKDGLGNSLVAGVSINAGVWMDNADDGGTSFVFAGGQSVDMGAKDYILPDLESHITLAEGVLVDVTGSAEVPSSVANNIVTVELRGSELADYPLQRNGVLRGATVRVDARLGTPIADVSGYVNLIEHSIGELTANGGTVSLKAGGAIDVGGGAAIDVSGGWVRYAGAVVDTTKLISAGHLYDITKAPNIVYDGIYSKTSTITDPKWGVSSTFVRGGLASSGQWEEGYLVGGNGGEIAMVASSMNVAGTLLGLVAANTGSSRTPPIPSRLSMSFMAQDTSYTSGSYSFPLFSPTPPNIVFQSELKDHSAALYDSPNQTLYISTELASNNGFGRLLIDNPDGNITIPASTTLGTAPNNLASVVLQGSNVTVNGSIVTPGGAISLNAYNIGIDELNSLKSIGVPTLPIPNAGRGNVVLGGSGILDARGLLVDDRLTDQAAYTPNVIKGGSVTAAGYNVDLQSGSLIDVSGGLSVGQLGKTSYGNAGSVSILAGRDIRSDLYGVLGGELVLGARLNGYSGTTTGGSLILQAPLIQIGGTAATAKQVDNSGLVWRVAGDKGAGIPDLLILQPGFLSQGGFNDYKFQGLGGTVWGQNNSKTEAKEMTPAVRIVSGTQITPQVESWVADLSPGADTLLDLSREQSDLLGKPFKLAFEGMTSIVKTAPNQPQSALLSGDFAMEKGSSESVPTLIRLSPNANSSVGIKGGSIDLQGWIYVPGGTITIKDDPSASTFNASTVNGTIRQCITTVYLGPGSTLSTAGDTMLTPNSYRLHTGSALHTGSVLDGGTISVSGNIVADAEALLDVSGSSYVLDLSSEYSVAWDQLDLHGVALDRVIPTRVDSKGGTLTLTGNYQLFTKATLRGAAGKPNGASSSAANGGSLYISSGLFPGANVIIPDQISMVVTAADLEFRSTAERADRFLGSGVVLKDGTSINPRGYISATTLGTALDFKGGGFDSLTLAGNVGFSGGKPIDLSARGRLSVGVDALVDVVKGGVVSVGDNTQVTLRAPYLVLGKSFLVPGASRGIPTDSSAVQHYLVPTAGSGTLSLSDAKLIDVGELTLKGISSLNLTAENGDVRGNGTLSVAGDVSITAGQIYPTTASTFTIAAYNREGTDSAGVTSTLLGTIKLNASGESQLPLSAGGTLNVYASVIEQNGVLRAPFGTINLGLDGSDNGLVNPVTNQPYIDGTGTATTTLVKLGPKSVTSVSAADFNSPIPYGILLNGKTWIDPTGLDITTTGVLTNGDAGTTVSLKAKSIQSEDGSKVDLRGGGDLFAYRWVLGSGGTKDILSTSSSFAVIPSYAADYAPFAPYNTSSAAYSGSDSGYVNDLLSVGDKIYLQAGSGLKAGYYTLLPARYALLPGAFLITRKSSKPLATTVQPDDSVLVSGYRFNSLNATPTLNEHPLNALFEVVSGKVAFGDVATARAEYSEYSANKYLTEYAADLSLTVPHLPADSGQLLLNAVQQMSLHGHVAAQATTGGLGGMIDINSQSDIIIAGKESDTGADQGLVLNATDLSSFSASSLLVGGRRTRTDAGVIVTAGTNSVSVENDADSPLDGAGEIVLVAKKSLTVADGSVIQSSGQQSAPSAVLRLGVAKQSGSGDGVLLRLSGDSSVSISRAQGSVSSAQSDGAKISIGASTLKGTAVIVDSTRDATLDAKASIDSDAITLSSGKIGLDFTGVKVGSGLELSEAQLLSLGKAKSLSLASYTSIDLYGSGLVGSSLLSSLSLHAGEVKGSGGKVTFEAQDIYLDNRFGGTSGADLAGTGGTALFKGDNIIHIGEAGSTSSNSLKLNQFDAVSFTASKGLVVEGKGELSSAGSLIVSSPIITGSSAADVSIQAKGDLRISNSGGSAGLTADSLGARISLKGASVSVDAPIILPSGFLSVESSSGNLDVSSQISVAGSKREFIDVTKYTGGGQVTLIAQNGNVTLASGGKIDVSSPSSLVAAGQLSVTASKGNIEFAGTLEGHGGSGGQAGSVVLDFLPTHDIALAPLNGILNQGGFTYSRNIRIRDHNVTVDGNVLAEKFRLSADNGSIAVTGKIDASGKTGGDIYLAAQDDISMRSGAVLDASGLYNDNAGKGGSILLESRNGIIDLQEKSSINLAIINPKQSTSDTLYDGGITGNRSDLAGDLAGRGTLHLRALRTYDSVGIPNGVKVNPLQVTIDGDPDIIIEGYKQYDISAYAGYIYDSLKTTVKNEATAFIDALGDVNGTATTSKAAPTASMIAGLQNKSRFHFQPGVEIVNNAADVGALTQIALDKSGSSFSGVANNSFAFPSGTGSSTIKIGAVSTKISADGTTTDLPLNWTGSLAANDVIKLRASGNITFTSGTSAIAVTLPSGIVSSTASSSSATTTVSSTASVRLVTLNAASSSTLTATKAGTTITFPDGTPGTDKISITGSATIKDANGKVRNTGTSSISLNPGDAVTLNSSGSKLTFASGTTALPVAVSANSQVAVSNAMIDTSIGNLTLLNTWDFASMTGTAFDYRYGVKNDAPGSLTLRATGNIVFPATLNSAKTAMVSAVSLSDGFKALVSGETNYSSTSPAQNLWLGKLLTGASWTYRLVAGADATAADYRQVSPLASVQSGSGSLLLGSGTIDLPSSGAQVNSRASVIPLYYQTVRTGTGDIDINTARDILFLNPIATIYTAGQSVSDATTLFSTGDFDQPVTAITGTGAGSQFYSAYFGCRGGNLSLFAQGEIARYVRTSAFDSTLQENSSKELPINWLYRRGEVDDSGVFAAHPTSANTLQSTAWWVDYSNFFEGVGTLGGGNVSLAAVGNVKNVDAVVATNARMPGSTGTFSGGPKVAVAPDATKLVELGGGDLSVSAGGNIDGGVFYVERGEGSLAAGTEIKTNKTRAAVETTSASSAVDIQNLPTTLFMGKGTFSLSAVDDLLLGPVANVMLLPQGLNNSSINKSYFSTYSQTASVNATSLCGDVSVQAMTDYTRDLIGEGSLCAWIENILSLTVTSTSGRISYFQPWLRLAEVNTSSTLGNPVGKRYLTAASILPPVVSAVSFSGDINLVGKLTLSPAPTGNAEFLAANAINGVTVNGKQLYGSSMVNISDADPLRIPSVSNPLSMVVHYTSSAPSATTILNAWRAPIDFTSLDSLFAETGAYMGTSASSLQGKQARHKQGTLLHADDKMPARFYALASDVSGITVYSGKAVRVLARRDIVDDAFYIQNTDVDSVSLFAAGRDIKLFEANSALRVALQGEGINALGNQVTVGPAAGGPTAGDVQVSGPGTLQVLAGRNLTLGSVQAISDGTSAGITSIGNLKNPALPVEGAEIMVAAGIGFAPGLTFAPNNESSSLHYNDFAARFLDPSIAGDSTQAGGRAARYLPSLGKLLQMSDTGDYQAVWDRLVSDVYTDTERAGYIFNIFFQILRDTGRDFGNPDANGYKSYQMGFDAIAALFPAGTASQGRWNGDISLSSRELRTKNGGAITILAPGGGLDLGFDLASSTTPPGILTDRGGGISIFAKNDVSVGAMRIFTLRGGDEIIWSSKGDIAAGISSKTIQSAPPTKVVIDPQSADVKNDLSGLATGGGIGVLATVVGVPPGDVDLIAPAGAIDAGDAGIRSSGKVNVSALVVVNAANIQAGGGTSGTPVVVAPNISGLTTASNTAAGASSSVGEAARQQQRSAAQQQQEMLPSIIQVEVLGYGGGEGEDVSKKKDESGNG